MQIWAPSYAEHGHKVMPYSAMPAAQKRRRVSNGGAVAVNYDTYIQNTYGSSGTNELVGYWPFKEASGNAIDLVGGNNSTSAIGVTQGVSGFLPTPDGETCYTFAGSSGNGLVIGAWFRPTYPITYEFWIKTTSATLDGAVHEFCGQGGASGAGHTGTAVGMVESSASGSIRFTTRSGTHNDFVFAWAQSTVYHVVLGSDGTNAGTVCYINGVSKTKTNTSTPQVPDTSIATFGTVGNSIGGSSFRGQMAKAAVYNSVLSGTKVTNNYNKGLLG